MTFPRLLISAAAWLSVCLSANALPHKNGISFSRTSGRFITPNGDQKNDTFYFYFANNGYIDVTGKIYDSQGRFVANMTPDQNTSTYLSWDGKSSNGQVVSGGAYIYDIEAEGFSYRGLVVVIR